MPGAVGRGPNERMMKNELSHLWLGIVVAGSLAGCTSDDPAGQSTKPVPDHFSDGLDLLAVGGAHPCAASVVQFDTTQVHYTYAYDSLGHTTSQIGVDATTGAPY